MLPGSHRFTFPATCCYSTSQCGEYSAETIYEIGSSYCETYNEEPARPAGARRIVLLPDTARADRRPDRQQAADGLRDAHQTRRASLLELSAPDAAGPYRRGQGDDGTGKPAGRDLLQHQG